MNLSEALNWRYATKRMNGQKPEQKDVESILEAIRMAPTSMGLQPFRLIVVEDADVRKQIHESACQQPQVIEGSHVLVFAVYNELSEAHVDEFINRVSNERNASLESLEGFKNMLLGGMNAMDMNARTAWAARQAYIALGFGLLSAAMLKVDATPMEGFNPAEMDKVLGLADLNLKSVVVLTLGFRNPETDYLLPQKKVRVPATDFFVRR
jgi:nitroreductase/dihydropteridine reductase